MRILIQVLISITIVIILPRIKFSIQLRKKRRNINVKSILKRKKFLRNIERTFCKAIMISSRRKIHLWIFRITHGNFKDRNYIQDICQNWQKLCMVKWITLWKWQKILMVILLKILIPLISENQWQYIYCLFMVLEMTNLIMETLTRFCWFLISNTLRKLGVLLKV